MDGERIELDFPALPAEVVDAPPGLLDALGIREPVAVARSSFDYLVEVDDPDIVRSLSPDLRGVASVEARGVMVTAPGDDDASGTASEYTMRVAYSPISSGTFAAAADLDRWLVEHVPSAAGTPETLFVFGMDPDTTYYFALQTKDEVPNTSGTSNSPGTQPAAVPQARSSSVVWKLFHGTSS